jgi:hypothetical protein
MGEAKQGGGCSRAEGCTRWRCGQTGGGEVREGAAEAEPLDADDMLLGDEEVVAMAVQELPPLV